MYSIKTKTPFHKTDSPVGRWRKYEIDQSYQTLINIVVIPFWGEAGRSAEGSSLRRG
jgi:hypothetical protein